MSVKVARLDFCIYYVCPHVVFVYVLCCVFVEVVCVFLSSLVDCVFPHLVGMRGERARWDLGVWQACSRWSRLGLGDHLESKGVQFSNLLGA